MNKIFRDFLVILAIIYGWIAFGAPAIIAWDSGISYTFLVMSSISYLWPPLLISLAAGFLIIILMHKEKETE